MAANHPANGKMVALDADQAAEIAREVARVTEAVKAAHAPLKEPILAMKNSGITYEDFNKMDVYILAPPVKASLSVVMNTFNLRFSVLTNTESPNFEERWLATKGLYRIGVEYRPPEPGASFSPYARKVYLVKMDYGYDLKVKYLAPRDDLSWHLERHPECLFVFAWEDEQLLQCSDSTRARLFYAVHVRTSAAGSSAGAAGSASASSSYDTPVRSNKRALND
tara:strand:+ start:45 stop:713 length:669 start_codon:yes stop_codon:yes gene_type:complete